ncbi:HflC protein [Halobacteriovorax sp. BALOs_7]|uniref:Protein HflC n=1 Tax=Halobacteriovorax vibrionivorans TaxID=2152716 RepID=A0ABY0IJU3_9BACT|nr:MULTISPECIES: protease modulator HflC [Halobacteriovorax]AYF45862.1 HflC protein [Halobacteriovorax sp. BALOs_7]RZF22902.1 protease modulator HflC [Halobacteriovorax vibrionivorans]TGD47305.1 protease modulator HflC [Halobacteriovorax sp. Y22]
MNKLIPLVVIVFIGLVLGKQSIFVINEGRQAIITEFGKPVGEPITEAGLHFKKPFIQDVRFVDKRILSWDGFPNQIPTKDKKFIKVDTTARFRIMNALKFIQTVRNTEGAKQRLDTILDSATRNVISSHQLVEAVRNSNAIIEKLESAKQNVNEIEEEITGDIENVAVGREKLSQLIVEKAEGELEQFGISLIDVQLRRISYEESVEKKVYERMISERQRIASKIRSIGSGEKAKIEGRLVRDLQTIQSEGYRKAQLIKGRAEAKASAVYARAFKQDPDFFEFIRTLEAYKKSIDGNTKLIISNDNEFLKFLR